MFDDTKMVEGLVPSKAMPLLKNMINGYLSKWEQVYVGVTAHPELRYQQHMADGWRKMVLIYEAFSPEIAQGMEQSLIAYAKKCDFLSLVVNVNPGGEGIGRARRSNYLYVLCK